MNNFATAITAIQKMDNDQLNRVVAKIKERRAYLARQQAMSFAVGDRVSFAARGMQVLGTVTKVNIKNILVKQDNAYTTWRVPATMLRPVQEMA